MNVFKGNMKPFVQKFEVFIPSQLLRKSACKAAFSLLLTKLSDVALLKHGLILRDICKCNQIPPPQEPLSVILFPMNSFKSWLIPRSLLVQQNSIELREPLNRVLLTWNTPCRPLNSPWIIIVGARWQLAEFHPGWQILTWFPGVFTCLQTCQM